MIITRKFGITTFCSNITKYLTPFALNVSPSIQMPKIKLKSQKLLIQNWWSESPFDIKGDLNIPVFSFKSNQYLEKSVEVPSDIFNQPLRRDLIYRLYNFRINLNKFTTVKTRNRAETAGSGIKMRPQKKSGRARMGSKRAPHLKKGGKAHGKKPKIYSYPLNSKIKLKALQALLSAKMSEGKIKIIDQQNVEQPKTKLVFNAIRNHEEDERTVFCIITSKNVNQNFQLAMKNISKIIWHDSYNLDVSSLFIADKIFFTLKGLQQFIQNIRKTKYVIYRQPYMPEIKQKTEAETETEHWNPQKPYEFKFRILAEYLELYDKVKEETPNLFDIQNKRIKKVQLSSAK